MRIILLIILLGACAKSTPPIANATNAQCGGIVWPTKLDKPSTPESHRAAAIRVLQVSGLRESYADMIEITLESMLKINPQLKQFEEGFREFFDKYAGYQAMEPDFAKLYTQVFDELQLRQVEAFYLSPTGQLAVKQLSKIMQEAGRIGERKVQEHQQELFEILMKYQKQQTPPPALTP